MRYILLALFLTGCIRNLKPEVPCGFIITEVGARTSWKEFVPVKVYIHANVPIQFVESIYVAALTWNTAAKRTVIEIEPYRYMGQSGFVRDDTNVISWVDVPSEMGSFHAVTRTWRWGALIIEGDIGINAYSGSFTPHNHKGEVLTDMTSLMVHEFGHLLGLDHSDIPASVMYPSLGYGQIRRELTNVDKQNLLCEYEL